MIIIAIKIAPLFPLEGQGWMNRGAPIKMRPRFQHALPCIWRAESLKARASPDAGVAPQQGFRGVTHRVTNPMHPEGTTTRKRGGAKGTPPKL